MSDVGELRSTLETHGQEHLLRFWDDLEPPQRKALTEQIDKIDFDRLDELIETYVRSEPPSGLGGKIEPPQIEPARPGDEDVVAAHAAASKHGKELLAGGKVAAFTVAGGQGTRLGFEGPKGCLEATPVAKKPLFQVFAEQILAAGRKAGKAIPWYVMTSPANDVATRTFFRQHNHFGLEPDDVFFLVQGTMPALSFDGKILMSAPDRLALSPDGHGGCFTALRQSGALDDMKTRGIELISYFQVDNPLVHAIDPLFIGLHSDRGAEMGAKCLPKRDPMEKLGNLCVVDGKVAVIEYSDMPAELARETTDDGRLRFSAGSIAIHVISREFAERLTEGGRCRLPFHRAEKKVPFVDESGEIVKPAKPNACKLEMFVFDALPLASETVILETIRSEEFSPIKNATGEDSLTSSLHDQVRRTATWLEDAGVTVPRDAFGQVGAAIEISPLYADSAEELKQKVSADLEIPAGGSVYLGSRGQTGGLK